MSTQAHAIGFSRYKSIRFWYQLASFGTALWLLFLFSLETATHLLARGGIVWLVPAAIVGLAAADVVSGVVHWAFDTLGTEETPILGPHVIKDFRFHHVDPKAILRHDFLEVNGDNGFVTALFLWLATSVAPLLPEGNIAIFARIAVSFFSFASLMTNVAHRWAHADDTSRLGRFMQRIGLSIAKDAHNVHHTRPYRSGYCITLGWMNPILDRLRFFRALEWMLGVRQTH